MNGPRPAQYGGPVAADRGCLDRTRLCSVRCAGRASRPVAKEMCAAVHIVIMGCGRVGAALALQLAPLEHTVAVIDQDPLAFRRLGDDFPRPPGHGRRLRPRDPDRGRHRAGRRVRRGQQRRQLQHHRRPGGPRDVRRPARRRPHLRPEAGRGVRAARHPHRRHRAVDVVPAAEGGARRDDRRGVARPVRRGRAGRGRPRTRAGSARGSPTSRRPPAPGPALVTRFGAGQLPLASTLIQSGDTLHVLATDDAPPSRCATVAGQRARGGARR